MMLKRFIFELCLFLLNLLKIEASQGWYPHHSYNYNNNRRTPDFWSWGYADDRYFPSNEPWRQKESYTTTSTTTTTTTTASPIQASGLVYSPCEPYNPQPPNYRKGRRVSVAKCYEYIWGIGQIPEKMKRKEDCEAEKRREYQRQCEMQGYSCNFAIGGRDTRAGEFPHMGAIGWQGTNGTWKFGCAGSLISPKFVLTAAHCSEASSADTSIADTKPKIIRFGDKNIVSTISRPYIYDKHKLDVNILRIISHPQYSSPKKNFDIALIELVKEITDFNIYIQPACLWAYEDLSSIKRRVTVTGWGIVKEDALEISPELQAVDIDLIEKPLCDSLLRKRCNRLWCGVQDHQICAGVLAGGVDSCKGDSGGPMQVRVKLPNNITGYMYNIVGVTSFGIGCARPNSPAIYTRVASFIDWIERIVWPEEF